MRTTHEKRFYEYLKSMPSPKTNTESQNILELGRTSETWISKIHSKLTFPSIKMFRWSHVHDSKCARISLNLYNALHTRKVCVRRMKNFLGTSKVKFFAKNQHKITEYSEAWQKFGDFNFKNLFEGHFSFIKNVSLVVRSWIKMWYIFLL